MSVECSGRLLDQHYWGHEVRRAKGVADSRRDPTCGVRLHRFGESS